MEFVKQSNVYNTYYPMFTIMIGTGLRCGELIGFTWKDINIKAKTVNVDHQLIYKNLGDGCKFHISTPKTESGIRGLSLQQNRAECRMDVKVLQYIMGHAHIDVTMEVYNHIGELTRIENEIARLDSMVLNA